MTDDERKVAAARRPRRYVEVARQDPDKYYLRVILPSACAKHNEDPSTDWYCEKGHADGNCGGYEGEFVVGDRHFVACNEATGHFLDSATHDAVAEEERVRRLQWAAEVRALHERLEREGKLVDEKTGIHACPCPICVDEYYDRTHAKT